MIGGSPRMKRVHPLFIEQTKRISEEARNSHNIRISETEVSKFAGDILKQIPVETFVIRRTKKGKGLF